MNYSDIMIIFEETIRDMEDLFVTYEQALALKELGFNETCLAGYEIIENGQLWIGNIEGKEQFNREFYILAPLKQQVFRWFRDEHKLNGETPYLPNVEKYGIVTSDMTVKPRDLSKSENFKRGAQVTNNFIKYDTYQEAESACIDKLIEIVNTLPKNIDPLYGLWKIFEEPKLKKSKQK